MSKLYHNKWAGFETYFVPLDTRRETVSGYEITYVMNEWLCRKATYYKSSLRDEEHFPVIGDVKIDIEEYVRKTMLDALSKRRTDE